MLESCIAKTIEQMLCRPFKIKLKIFNINTSSFKDTLIVKILIISQIFFKGMYIWYLSLYEPLPLNGKNVRKMRTGWICDALLEADNQVELWIPGFDHLSHKNFRNKSSFESIDKSFSIQYLKGLDYESDTSIRRFFHNRFLANEFLKVAKARTKLPDLIITQIPSLELAYAATKFAKTKNIPSIVDIRDLWPDIYKRLLPDSMKWTYKILFFKEIIKLRAILNNCNEIIAISKNYLNWAKKYCKKNLSYKNVFYIGYCSKDISKSNLKRWNSFLSKRSIDKERKFIIFSGTFCNSYDLSPIVKALNIINKNKKQYHFLLAGEGDLPEDTLRDLKNCEDVSLLGWLDKSDLSLCLSHSDIGLAPYASDAMMSLPNKFFEYMAYNLPIISSLRSEMAIIIESKKLGFNYLSNSPRSLSNAISKLYSPESDIKSIKESIKREYNNNFDGIKIYKDLTNFVQLIYLKNTQEY